MFMKNDNSEYIVCYRFKGSNKMIEKSFPTEHEAYGFYHGLENVDFRCFKIKTVVTTQIVVLYERNENNALREV